MTQDQMHQGTDERPTIEELAESLTGFEELAIKAHFDQDLSDIKSGTMMLRALVFTQRVRGGEKAAEAKKYAMGLPIKALPDLFADDDEVTPDEPTTAAGKDDEQHE